MRVAERRFIIWTPPDLQPEAVQAAGAHADRLGGAAAAPPGVLSGRSGGAARRAAAGPGAAAAGAAGGAWDAGLAGIWRNMTGRLQVLCLAGGRLG